MQKIDFGTNESFIENYQKLKSSRKMSELYRCGKTTILNHAKKIGYDVSGNKERKISTIPPEEVFQLYETLGSCDKIGELYNCSGTAVRNYLNKYGYETNLNLGAKLKDISDEEFIETYEELKSAEQVGKKFGCSATAILNHAKKIGYDVNSNKTYKLTAQNKEEIIKQYNIKTSTVLAKEYNVTRGMITKIWHDANLIGKETTLSPYYVDLTGQHFGKWTVLEKTERRGTSGGIYWKCQCECGVIKEILSESLQNGTSLSCGSHSNISKGNEKIKQLLLNAGIVFETEKKFETCKDKKILPFDFFVNNEYLIEYDGEQHYDKNSIFNYEYTHTHDLIKNEWCKINGIPLIRIPYTHFKNLQLEDLLIKTSKFKI